jgi:GNAT superfamily N-acetyltransferase
MTDNPFLLRDLRVGDLGQVIRRQGELYALEYGWDLTFEALVAEIAGGFVQRMDPERERFWIAEKDGAVVGSVFVMRISDEEAKLRILYVEPAARGLGVGRALVDACIAFAREKGYRRLTLWTNDVLHAARRIYEERGFVLTKEEKHHSFGKDLVGQFWQLNV